MRNLLDLLIKNGGLMLLMLIQALCFYILVSTDSPQRPIYLYNAKLVSAKLLNWERKWMQYNRLYDIRDSLQRDNARFKSDYENLRMLDMRMNDTVKRVTLLDSILRSDSLRRVSIRPYYVISPARVVNNSIHLNNNWLLINRGARDSLTPHCGVIASDGIVGVVRFVDPQFSAVMSLLHRQTRISAMLKRQGAFGSLVWDTQSPRRMTLKYIPKHINVAPGDTIVTSGMSAMFPKGLLVGIVDDKPGVDPENTYFMNIPVRLSHDLSKTDLVYVVRNIYSEDMQRLMEKVKYE